MHDLDHCFPRSQFPATVKRVMRHTTARRVWIVLSILMGLAMVAFTVAPILY